MPLRALTRVAVIGLLTLCATAPGLAHAERVFSRDGLTIERKTTRPGFFYRRLHPTGQASGNTTWTVRWRGTELCGDHIGGWLFPDVPRRHNEFACVSQVAFAGGEPLLGFRGADSELVVVYPDTSSGELSLRRIAVSADPRRDKVRRLHLRPAAPGWSKLKTAWYETVLFRHMPLKAVHMGPGEVISFNGTLAIVVEAPREGVPLLRAMHVRPDAHPESVASIELPTDCAPFLALADDSIEADRRRGAWLQRAVHFDPSTRPVTLHLRSDPDADVCAAAPGPY